MGWIADAPRRARVIVEPNVIEMSDGNLYPALAIAFMMPVGDAEPITVNLVGSIDTLRALQSSIGKAVTLVQRQVSGPRVR